jgi:hypothetical protein
MRRLAAAACLALSLPLAALAEGALSCRWQPGSTAVAYAASDGAEATDVRALFQGAPLVGASGGAPGFASLTRDRAARVSEPLLCASEEGEPADGMLELTFSRKVRLGIEYTLGRCQLFYRCPSGATGLVAPQLYLGFVGGGAPASRPLPPPPAEAND